MKKKFKKINPPHIGKNPESDWRLILGINAFLTIAILVGLGYHFYTVKKFIDTGVTPNVNKGVDTKKTKEQELKETINIYTEKKETHETILRNSSNIIQKVQVVQATTTASSTVTASSTSRN